MLQLESGLLKYDSTVHLYNTSQAQSNLLHAFLLFCFFLGWEYSGFSGLRSHTTNATIDHLCKQIQA